MINGHVGVALTGFRSTFHLVPMLTTAELEVVTVSKFGLSGLGLVRLIRP